MSEVHDRKGLVVEMHDEDEQTPGTERARTEGDNGTEIRGADGVIAEALRSVATFGPSW